MPVLREVGSVVLARISTKCISLARTSLDYLYLWTPNVADKIAGAADSIADTATAKFDRFSDSWVGMRLAEGGGLLDELAKMCWSRWCRIVCSS